jgi:hypothetical protein
MRESFWFFVLSISFSLFSLANGANLYAMRMGLIGAGFDELGLDMKIWCGTGGISNDVKVKILAVWVEKRVSPLRCSR